MDRIETLESMLDRLRRNIKDNKLKNSKQREEVVSVLYRSEVHMSPEDIAKAIKNKDRGASISSIYRILSFLERENFVSPLEVGGGGKRYEISAKSHHDHIVCLECGKISEFVNEEIEKLQISIATSLGAKLISHDQRLFVKCAKCLAK